MLNNSAEEKILQAAFAVIAENTINKTRMHLIAERSGMVQSNVHYYFKTKKDLLLAVLDMLQDTFTTERQHIVADDSGSIRDKLKEFLEQKKHIILDVPEYDRVQIDYWSSGQVDEQINAAFIESNRVWREHISDVISCHFPALPEERRSLLASVMISMMMGASLQYLSSPSSFDLDQYFELCLVMIMQQLEG